MTAYLTPVRRRAVIHGVIVGGLTLSVIELLGGSPFAFDAYAYWSVDLNALYQDPVGAYGLFPYAPPLALLAAPLGWLPWPVFVVGWWTLLVGALVWLGRDDLRSLIIFAAFPPVVMELVTGNIHILLAAAIVLGFRYPAAWAFVLLTKVSPGVGLLWFVFRREWRSLAIAVGATAAIVISTFVLVPHLWIAWFEFLVVNVNYTPFNFPLWTRLPLAVLIVWWGARRDAYWTVPVAATIALPVLWLSGLAMLVAVWPLRNYHVRDADQPSTARGAAEATPDHHPAGV